MKTHHHTLQAYWNGVLWIVQQRWHAVQRSDANRQADPELQQKAMNLVGRHCAMANQ
ncbi:hypothetical protein D3C84_818070 [compost metagenome]